MLACTALHLVACDASHVWVDLVHKLALGAANEALGDLHDDLIVEEALLFRNILAVPDGLVRIVSVLQAAPVAAMLATAHAAHTCDHVMLSVEDDVLLCDTATALFRTKDFLWSLFKVLDSLVGTAVLRVLVLQDDVDLVTLECLLAPDNWACQLRASSPLSNLLKRVLLHARLHDLMSAHELNES